MNLCVHGCGKPGLFLVEYKQHWICSASANSCEAIRTKNSAGVANSHTSGKRLPQKEIYRTLPAETKDKMAWNRGKFLIDLETTFVENSKNKNDLYKKMVKADEIPGIKYECDACKTLMWSDKELSLEVHHINGNNQDNRLENLQLLCPNCHSLTSNFRNCGRAKNPYRSDGEFINAITCSVNARQALIKLGLAAKGANYQRIHDLRCKYSITFKEKWCPHPDSNRDAVSSKGFS